MGNSKSKRKKRQKGDPHSSHSDGYEYAGSDRNQSRGPVPDPDRPANGQPPPPPSPLARHMSDELRRNPLAEKRRDDSLERRRVPSANTRRASSEERKREQPTDRRRDPPPEQRREPSTNSRSDLIPEWRRQPSTDRRINPFPEYKRELLTDRRREPSMDRRKDASPPSRREPSMDRREKPSSQRGSEKSPPFKSEPMPPNKDKPEQSAGDTYSPRYSDVNPNSNSIPCEVSTYYDSGNVTAIDQARSRRRTYTPHDSLDTAHTSTFITPRDLMALSSPRASEPFDMPGTVPTVVNPLTSSTKSSAAGTPTSSRQTSASAGSSRPSADRFQSKTSTYSKNSDRRVPVMRETAPPRQQPTVDRFQSKTSTYSKNSDRRVPVMRETAPSRQPTVDRFQSKTPTSRDPSIGGSVKSSTMRETPPSRLQSIAVGDPRREAQPKPQAVTISGESPPLKGVSCINGGPIVIVANPQDNARDSQVVCLQHPQQRQPVSCTCPPAVRTATPAVAVDDGRTIVGEIEDCCVHHFHDQSHSRHPQSLDDDSRVCPHCNHAHPGRKVTRSRKACLWMKDKPLGSRAEDIEQELQNLMNTDIDSPQPTMHCSTCSRPTHIYRRHSSWSPPCHRTLPPPPCLPPMSRIPPPPRRCMPPSPPPRPRNPSPPRSRSTPCCCHATPPPPTLFSCQPAQPRFCHAETCYCQDSVSQASRRCQTAVAEASSCCQAYDSQEGMLWSEPSEDGMEEVYIDADGSPGYTATMTAADPGITAAGGTRVVRKRQACIWLRDRRDGSPKSVEDVEEDLQRLLNTGLKTSNTPQGDRRAASVPRRSRKRRGRMATRTPPHRPAIPAPPRHQNTSTSDETPTDDVGTTTTCDACNDSSDERLFEEQIRAAVEKLMEMKKRLRQKSTSNQRCRPEYSSRQSSPYDSSTPYAMSSPDSTPPQGISLPVQSSTPVTEAPDQKQTEAKATELLAEMSRLQQTLAELLQFKGNVDSLLQSKSSLQNHLDELRDEIKAQRQQANNSSGVDNRSVRNISPGSSVGPTEERKGILRDSSFSPKRVLISDDKPAASKDAFTNTVLTRGSRTKSTSPRSSADPGTPPRGVAGEGNNSNAIRESAEKPYSPTPSPRMPRPASLAEAWGESLQREASASQTVRNQDTPVQPCTPSAVNSQGFDACSTCQRPLAECSCRLGSENNNSDRWPDDEGLPRSPRHCQALFHQRPASDWHAGASRQPYTLNPREHPVDYDSSPPSGRSQRSGFQPQANEDHSRHYSGFTSNGRNPLRQRLVFEDDIQRYVNEPAQVKRVKGVLKSESFYEDEVETFPASSREKRRGTMNSRTEYDEEFDTLPSLQSDGGHHSCTRPTSVDIPVQHISESQPSPQRVDRNARDAEEVRVVKEWDGSNRVEIPVAHTLEPQPSPQRVDRNVRDAEEVRVVKEWDGSNRVEIPVAHTPEPQPLPQRVRRKPRNAERMHAVTYTTKKVWDGSTTSQSYIDEEVLECPTSRNIKSREVKFTQREEPRGDVLEPEPEIYCLETSFVDQPNTSDYEEEEPVLGGRDSPPRKRCRVAPPGSTSPRHSQAYARISRGPPCLNRAPLRRNSHHYCGYNSEGPQGCVCNSRSAHSFGKDSARPYCIVCESATTQNLEPGAEKESRNKDVYPSSARQGTCRPWGSHSSTRDTMCRRDQAAAMKSQTKHCREMPTRDPPEFEESLSPQNGRRSSVRDMRQSGHSGRVGDPFPEDVRGASVEKRRTSSDGNRLSPAPSGTLRSPREVIQNVPNEDSWEEFTASGKRLPPPVTPEELMALKNRKKKQARESLCEPDEPSLQAAIRKAQRRGSFLYPKKHDCGIARKSWTPAPQTKPRTKRRKSSTPCSVSSTHFSRWASPPEPIRKERSPNMTRASSASPVRRTNESGSSSPRIRSRSESPDDSTRRLLQSRIERCHRSLTLARCSPEEPSFLDEDPDFVEGLEQELQVVPYQDNQAAPKPPKGARAETHGRNDAPQMHYAGLPQVEIRIAINSPPPFMNATPHPRRASPSPSATCVAAANTDVKDRASPVSVEVLDSISGTRQVANFGPANVISVQPAGRSPLSVQALDADGGNMQGVTRNNAQYQQREEQVQYGPSEDFPFSQFVSGGEQQEPGIFVGVMIRRKETNCCPPQNREEKSAEDGANEFCMMRDACVGTDSQQDHDMQDLAAAVMQNIPNFDFSEQPFVMTIESETLVTEKGGPIEDSTCLMGSNSISRTYLGQERVSESTRSSFGCDVAGRTSSESNGNYPNYEPGYHVEMVPSDLAPGEKKTQGATVQRYSPPTRDTERRGGPSLCDQNVVDLCEEVLSGAFKLDSPPRKTIMVKKKTAAMQTVDVGTETDPCLGIKPCISPPGSRHRPLQEKKHVKIDGDPLPTDPNERESDPGAPAGDKVCCPKCKSPPQIPTRQADDEALNLKSFLEEQEDSSISKGIPAAPAWDTTSCPKCRSPPQIPTRQTDDESLKLKSFPEEQVDSSISKPMSWSSSGDRRYSEPAMKLQKRRTSEDKICSSCRSVFKDAAHSTPERRRKHSSPADLRSTSHSSEGVKYILSSSAVDEGEEGEGSLDRHTVLSVRPSLLARRLETLSRQAAEDRESDMDSFIPEEGEDSDNNPSSEKAEQIPTRVRAHSLPTTSHAKKYDKGSDRHSQKSTEREEHACPNHIHEDTVDSRARRRVQTLAHVDTAPELMRQPNQESPLGSDKSEQITRPAMQSSVNEPGCSAAKEVKQILTRERIQSPTGQDADNPDCSSCQRRSRSMTIDTSRPKEQNTGRKIKQDAVHSHDPESLVSYDPDKVHGIETEDTDVDEITRDTEDELPKKTSYPVSQFAQPSPATTDVHKTSTSPNAGEHTAPPGQSARPRVVVFGDESLQSRPDYPSGNFQQQQQQGLAFSPPEPTQPQQQFASAEGSPNLPVGDPWQDRSSFSSSGSFCQHCPLFPSHFSPESFNRGRLYPSFASLSSPCGYNQPLIVPGPPFRPMGEAEPPHDNDAPCTHTARGPRRRNRSSPGSTSDTSPSQTDQSYSPLPHHSVSFQARTGQHGQTQTGFSIFPPNLANGSGFPPQPANNVLTHNPVSKQIFNPNTTLTVSNHVYITPPPGDGVFTKSYVNKLQYPEDSCAEAPSRYVHNGVLEGEGENRGRKKKRNAPPTDRSHARDQCQHHHDPQSPFCSKWEGGGYTCSHSSSPNRKMSFGRMSPQPHEQSNPAEQGEELERVENFSCNNKPFGQQSTASQSQGQQNVACEDPGFYDPSPSGPRIDSIQHNVLPDIVGWVPFSQLSVPNSKQSIPVSQGGVVKQPPLSDSESTSSSQHNDAPYEKRVVRKHRVTISMKPSSHNKLVTTHRGKEETPTVTQGTQFELSDIVELPHDQLANKTPEQHREVASSMIVQKEKREKCVLPEPICQQWTEEINQDSCKHLDEEKQKDANQIPELLRQVPAEVSSAQPISPVKDRVSTDVAQETKNEKGQVSELLRRLVDMEEISLACRTAEENTAVSAYNAESSRSATKERAPTISATNESGPTIGAANESGPTIGATNGRAPTISATNESGPTIGATNGRAHTIGATNGRAPTISATKERAHTIGATSERAPTISATNKRASTISTTNERVSTSCAKNDRAPTKNATIERAPTSSATIERTPISNAIIERAPTSNATIERAPISNAIIERAPTSNAIIERAPNSNATIERAPISNATIERAPISNAIIERAPNSNAIYERTPTSYAIYERAPTSNATIERAPFSNATIERAPISNATIERAPISNATIERAPISYATIERAPISSATIERAPTISATNENTPFNIAHGPTCIPELLRRLEASEASQQPTHSATQDLTPNPGTAQSVSATASSGVSPVGPSEAGYSGELLYPLSSRNTGDAQWLQFHHMKKTEKLKQKIQNLKEQQRNLIERVRTDCLNMVDQEVQGKDAQILEERITKARLKEAIVSLQKQLTDMERESWKATLAAETAQQDVAREKLNLENQLGNVQTEARIMRAEKEDLAAKLEAAQARKSELEIQLNEAKFSDKEKEVLSSQQAIAITNYKNLVDLCHEKYQEQRDTASRLQAELDHITITLEERDQESDTLRTQLDTAKTVIAKRRRQLQQFKMMQTELRQQYQQEQNLSDLAIKEKKAVEDKLHLETSRYSSLLSQVKTQNKKLVSVRSRVESLDPNRLKKQFEIRYRAKVDLVLRQVGDILDHRSAVVEAAEMTQQEMDFRQRAHESNVQMLLQRNQQLIALQKAASSEARLHHDISTAQTLFAKQGNDDFTCVSNTPNFTFPETILPNRYSTKVQVPTEHSHLLSQPKATAGFDKGRVYPSADPQREPTMGGNTVERDNLEIRLRALKMKMAMPPARYGYHVAKSESRSYLATIRPYTPQFTAVPTASPRDIPKAPYQIITPGTPVDLLPQSDQWRVSHIASFQPLASYPDQFPLNTEPYLGSTCFATPPTKPYTVLVASGVYNPTPGASNTNGSGESSSGTSETSREESTTSENVSEVPSRERLVSNAPSPAQTPAHMPTSENRKKKKARNDKDSRNRRKGSSSGHDSAAKRGTVSFTTSHEPQVAAGSAPGGQLHRLHSDQNFSSPMMTPEAQIAYLRRRATEGGTSEVCQPDPQGPEMHPAQPGQGLSSVGRVAPEKQSSIPPERRGTYTIPANSAFPQQTVDQDENVAPRSAEEAVSSRTKSREDPKQKESRKGSPGKRSPKHPFTENSQRSSSVDGDPFKAGVELTKQTTPETSASDRRAKFIVDQTQTSGSFHSDSFEFVSSDLNLAPLQDDFRFSSDFEADNVKPTPVAPGVLRGNGASQQSGMLVLQTPKDDSGTQKDLKSTSFQSKSSFKTQSTQVSGNLDYSTGSRASPWQESFKSCVSIQTGESLVFVNTLKGAIEYNTPLQQNQQSKANTDDLSKTTRESQTGPDVSHEVDPPTHSSRSVNKKTIDSQIWSDVSHEVDPLDFPVREDERKLAYQLTAKSSASTQISSMRSTGTTFHGAPAMSSTNGPPKPQGKARGTQPVASTQTGYEVWFSDFQETVAIQTSDMDIRSEDDSPNTPFSNYTDTNKRHPTNIYDSSVKPTGQQTNKIRRHSKSEIDSSTTLSSHNTGINRRHSTGIDGSSPSLQAALHRMRSTSVDGSSTQPFGNPTELHRKHSTEVDDSSTLPFGNPTELHRKHSTEVDDSSTQPFGNPTELHRKHSTEVDDSSTLPFGNPTELHRKHSTEVDDSSTLPFGNPTELHRKHSTEVDDSSTQPYSHPTELHRKHSTEVDDSSTQPFGNPTELHRKHSTEVDDSSTLPFGNPTELHRKHSTEVDDSSTLPFGNPTELHRKHSTEVDDSSTQPSSYHTDVGRRLSTNVDISSAQPSGQRSDVFRKHSADVDDSFTNSPGHCPEMRKMRSTSVDDSAPVSLPPPTKVHTTKLSGPAYRKISESFPDTQSAQPQQPTVLPSVLSSYSTEHQDALSSQEPLPLTQEGQPEHLPSNWKPVSTHNVLDDELHHPVHLPTTWLSGSSAPSPGEDRGVQYEAPPPPHSAQGSPSVSSASRRTSMQDSSEFTLPTGWPGIALAEVSQEGTQGPMWRNSARSFEVLLVPIPAKEQQTSLSPQPPSGGERLSSGVDMSRRQNTVDTRTDLSLQLLSQEIAEIKTKLALQSLNQTFKGPQVKSSSESLDTKIVGTQTKPSSESPEKSIAGTQTNLSSKSVGQYTKDMQHSGATTSSKSNTLETQTNPSLLDLFRESEQSDSAKIRVSLKNEVKMSQTLSKPGSTQAPSVTVVKSACFQTDEQEFSTTATTTNTFTQTMKAGRYKESKSVQARQKRQESRTVPGQAKQSKEQQTISFSETSKSNQTDSTGDSSVSSTSKPKAPKKSNTESSPCAVAVQTSLQKVTSGSSIEREAPSIKSKKRKSRKKTKSALKKKRQSSAERKKQLETQTTASAQDLKAALHGKLEGSELKLSFSTTTQVSMRFTSSGISTTSSRLSDSRQSPPSYCLPSGRLPASPSSRPSTLHHQATASSSVRIHQQLSSHAGLWRMLESIEQQVQHISTQASTHLQLLRSHDLRNVEGHAPSPVERGVAVTASAAIQLSQGDYTDPLPNNGVKESVIKPIKEDKKLRFNEECSPMNLTDAEQSGVRSGARYPQQTGQDGTLEMSASCKSALSADEQALCVTVSSETRLKNTRQSTVEQRPRQAELHLKADAQAMAGGPRSSNIESVCSAQSTVSPHPFGALGSANLPSVAYSSSVKFQPAVTSPQLPIRPPASPELPSSAVPCTQTTANIIASAYSSSVHPASPGPGAAFASVYYTAGHTSSPTTVTAEATNVCNDQHCPSPLYQSLPQTFQPPASPRLDANHTSYAAVDVRSPFDTAQHLNASSTVSVSPRVISVSKPDQPPALTTSKAAATNGPLASSEPYGQIQASAQAYTSPQPTVTSTTVSYYDQRGDALYSNQSAPLQVQASSSVIKTIRPTSPEVATFCQASQAEPVSSPYVDGYLQSPRSIAGQSTLPPCPASPLHTTSHATVTAETAPTHTDPRPLSQPFNVEMASSCNTLMPSYHPDTHIAQASAHGMSGMSSAAIRINSPNTFTAEALSVYPDRQPQSHFYQGKTSTTAAPSISSPSPVAGPSPPPIHISSQVHVSIPEASSSMGHQRQSPYQTEASSVVNSVPLSSPDVIVSPVPKLISHATASHEDHYLKAHSYQAKVPSSPVSAMPSPRPVDPGAQDPVHTASRATVTISSAPCHPYNPPASAFPPSHAEGFSCVEHRPETPCRQAENLLSAGQSSPSPCIEARQRSPTPDGYRITPNTAAASSDMQHSPCAYQQVPSHVCHNGASSPRVDERTSSSSYETRKAHVQSCAPQPGAIQVSSRTTCTVNSGTPQQFARSRSASTPRPCPCRPCHPPDGGPEVATQCARHCGQPSPCTPHASPPYSCLGYSTAARGGDCGLGSSSPYVHPSNIPRPHCTLTTSSPSCRSGGPGIVGFAGPGQLCSLSHPPFAAYQRNVLGMGSASAATPFEVYESVGSCEIARGFVPSPCPSPVCSPPPCRGSQCTPPPCPSAVCPPSPCPSPVLAPSPCSGPFSSPSPCPNPLSPPSPCSNPLCSPSTCPSPLRSPSPSTCASPACVSPVPFGTWPPPPSFSSRPTKEKSKSQKQDSASSRSYVPGSTTAPSSYGTQSKKDTGGTKSSPKFGKSTAGPYPTKTSGTRDYATPGPSRDQRTAAVSSPLLRATSRSPPPRHREEITEEGVTSEDGSFASWIPDFLKAVSPPSRRRRLGANIGVDKDSGSSGRSGTDRRENSQEDPFIL